MAQAATAHLPARSRHDRQAAQCGPGDDRSPGSTSVLKRSATLVDSCPEWYLPRVHSGTGGNVMQLLYRTLYACGVFFAAISMFYAAPVSAQTTRTWVSGSGNDNNPCTRTAPCLTFFFAQLQTQDGGEIICLDTAGFGTITITKSLTIDCTGNSGSILAQSATSGVLINTPGVRVVLRGLAINGGTSTSNSGVRFLQGASLTVVDCYISNFNFASLRARLESHA